MIEKEIIKDQKQTIHRLQKECTEKYEFHISETNSISFTEMDLLSFKNVEYTDDNGKGKIIPIKRDDGKFFQIIVPIELIEEVRE